MADKPHGFIKRRKEVEMVTNTLVCPHTLHYSTASHTNSPEPSESHVIIPKCLKSKGEVTVPDECLTVFLSPPMINKITHRCAP